MKNIVKLTQIYTPEMAKLGSYLRWAIAPACANAGEEVGETYEVELPEGYEVAENKCGFKMIFDSSGIGYDLGVMQDDSPCLLGTRPLQILHVIDRFYAVRLSIRCVKGLSGRPANFLQYVREVQAFDSKKDRDEWIDDDPDWRWSVSADEAEKAAEVCNGYGFVDDDDDYYC